MTGSAEVPYLLAMLRRRLRVLVLGLLLGVLAALLAGASADRYQAQAQLLIGGPATGGSDATSLERNLNSQLSVLRSRETAQAVSERLDGPSTAEVADSTTISEVPGADVVLIQTVAATSVRAQAIADAYVDVYLETSAAQAQNRITPELKRLDDRLTALDQQISATNEQIAQAVAPYLRRTGPSAGVPDPRTVAPEASARQQLLLNEYDRVLGQRQSLESEQRLRRGSSVLQAAVADDAPVGPDRRQQIGIVLVAGLLSTAVALVIDALSGRIVSDQELEAAVGARIAARLPDPRRGMARLTRKDGARAINDEVRLLWLKAEQLLPPNRTGVVVVTGAATGSGSTTVATALARQFALAGKRVVVVDAVGGPDSASERFPAPDAQLTDMGHGVLLLRHTDARAPRSAALSDAVAGLEGQADVVVVDSEPVLGSALGVAREAHVLVLVVNGARAKATQLEELGLMLSGFRDRMLPVVTNLRSVGRLRSAAVGSTGQPMDQQRDAVVERSHLPMR